MNCTEITVFGTVPEQKKTFNSNKILAIKHLAFSILTSNYFFLTVENILESKFPFTCSLVMSKEPLGTLTEWEGQGTSGLV